MQLGRLGATIPRLPDRPAERPSSSRDVGGDSRLSDPSCGSAASLCQYAESGTFRDSVPVSGSTWGGSGGPLKGSQGQTGNPTTGGAECTGNGGIAQCHAREKLAHDRAHLRWGASRVRVLPTAYEGYRLRPGLIFVRSGKGGNDRSTLLPDMGRRELRTQLGRSEALFRTDRASGLDGVSMPDALWRKYSNAGRELGWFWYFQVARCPRTLALELSPSPCQRLSHPKGGQCRRPEGDYPQACFRTYLETQHCHAPAIQRRGYQTDPGIFGPRECRDYDGLYPRR